MLIGCGCALGWPKKAKRGSTRHDLESEGEAPRLVEKVEEYIPIPQAIKSSCIFNSSQGDFTKSTTPVPEPLTKEISEDSSNESRQS